MTGRDYISVAAFIARAEGRPLDFLRAEDDTIRDEQTGSTWTLFGRAVSGPLRGHERQAVEHLDTLWFAWIAFQPDTDLVAGR